MCETGQSLIEDGGWRIRLTEWLRRRAVMMMMMMMMKRLQYLVGRIRRKEGRIHEHDSTAIAAPDADAADGRVDGKNGHLARGVI